MLYRHTARIKEWRDVVRRLLCRTTLSRRHNIGMREKTHGQNTQRKQSLMFIYYIIMFHVHMITVWCTFLQENRCRTMYIVTLFKNDWRET